MVIYLFTHKDSGRVYVGQSISPEQRHYDHIYASKHSPPTYHFHNALKKYGESAFDYEIIDEASTIDELNILEEFYINKYDAIKNGFNIRKGGSNKTHHPDSIERMRIAQKEAHAKRRAEGREGGWTRRDGGPMKGKAHPNKGGTCANKGKKKGMTWEEIYGVEGARERREALQNRRNAKLGG